MDINLKKNPAHIVIAILFLFSFLSFFLLIAINWSRFSEKYDEKLYEKKYNNSQYVIPQSKNPISDDIIYSHAAYQYAKGLNPILINSDHPPLGKYLIGWIILLTGNHRVSALFFGLGTLFIISLTVYEFTKSMLPVLIVLTFAMPDTVFRDQIIYSPLLDIIQLFFMICFFYFLLLLYHRKRLLFGILAGISLGAMSSAKMFFPAVILLVTTGLFMLFKKYSLKKIILSIFLLGSVATFVYFISYFQFFHLGGNLRGFMGAQKWIFLYWKDNSVTKLHLFGNIFPFVLFNKWYVWWGNDPIISFEHWSILWPLFFVTGIAASIYTFFQSLLLYFRKMSNEIPFTLLLALWIIVAISYLSLVPISPRYLMLFNFPIYILLSVYIHRLFLKK